MRWQNESGHNVPCSSRFLCLKFRPISKSNDRAVFNPYRPLSTVPIPKAIVFREATQRTGVVVDAHDLVSTLGGHVIGDALSDQCFCIWKHDPPSPSIVRDSPSLGGQDRARAPSPSRARN